MRWFFLVKNSACQSVGQSVVTYSCARFDCVIKYEIIRVLSRKSGEQQTIWRGSVKTVYLDRTTSTQLIVILSEKDYTLLNAGTTVYSMPVREKNDEYRRYGEEYDIHFIFDDNVPMIPFYTVPQVDIFAVDSSGGYIGTVGETTDLKSNDPICYIDRHHRCYLIAETGKEFLACAGNWKEKLRPYEAAELFASIEEAKQKHEFLDVDISALKDAMERKQNG